MMILPAIDIMDGKPVRLFQGDYDQKESVGESVLAIAQTFVKAGAEWIHMVDLDGAKAGHPVNSLLIKQVAQTLRIPVEVGGGIRNEETIRDYLENGVQRVILGTSAIEDEALLNQMLDVYGERIAVGIDCKDGYVFTRGWLAASSLHYVEFAKSLEAKGVKTIIVTDISKDGTLEGANLGMYETLKKNVELDLIASGGIHSIMDIKALKAIGVDGAIMGKAIYHKAIDLSEAIRIGKED